MSAERERLLEAYLKRATAPSEEVARVARECYASGFGEDYAHALDAVRSVAFRAGYGAREPEVERLRAENRELLAEVAHQKDIARRGTDLRHAAERELAAARERVAELEGKLERRRVYTAEWVKRAEQAEARVRELTIVLGESQERLVRSQRVAEQALNERDEARKLLAWLENDVLYMGSEAAKRVRALLAPKEAP